jgi:hypothetical protein
MVYKRGHVPQAESRQSRRRMTDRKGGPSGPSVRDIDVLDPARDGRTAHRRGQLQHP